MIDSAANTLSPTADSSMFSPLLPSVSSLDANAASKQSSRYLSPPSPSSHSEFPTDHNTISQNGRQRSSFSFFFFSTLLPHSVARQPQSVEPRDGRPLAQALLRARVAKWVGGACENSFREGRVKRRQGGRECARKGGVERGVVAESFLRKL